MRRRVSSWSLDPGTASFATAIIEGAAPKSPGQRSGFSCGRRPAGRNLPIQDTAILQVTGLSVSQGFLIAYLATLGVLYAAIVGLGRTIYASWWAVGFLVVGLTMRHRIADTAVNTLEGYFHPRQLAFAVGLGAVAIFLKGRTWLSLCVVVLAMLAHPTTGLWFAVLVGSAALVSEQRSRPGVVGVAIAAAAVAIWAVVGPLRAQLVVMDQTWVEVLAIKDYLFVSDWPLSTWAGNLGMAVLVGMIYRTRRSLGLVSRQETGMVIGCAVLLGLFFASLPLASAHVALVVQLQVNRIFWLFDIIGSTYLGWLLVECPVSSRRLDRAAEIILREQLRDGSAELRHYRVHDFRVTCETRLANLGFNQEVRDAVLGHAKPGLQKTYNKHDYVEEKQAALTAYARRRRFTRQPD